MPPRAAHFFSALFSPSTGEFFANHSAGLLPLGCDRESGEQVREGIGRIDRKSPFVQK